jgi:tRNA G18 (ribose-2'-O)-methylase SpoU
VPQIIQIDDASDPRIELYCDIRERDLVGRRDLFIAEGKVVVEKLLHAKKAVPVSLLIAAHRIDRLQALLSHVPIGVPIYAAAAPIIDAVAGFKVHRGILAIGRRDQPLTAQALLSQLPPRAIIVMLSAIANHDNMGGIFRNAAAFGADAVLLDHDCCDPLYRKSIRVSVGAALLVPWARIPRDAEPLNLLGDNGFTAVSLSPTGDRRLAEMELPDRLAILLGAEGEGLSSKLMDHSLSVRIPMRENFDSLNVATASGIALHHFREVCGASPEAAT